MAFSILLLCLCLFALWKWMGGGGIWGGLSAGLLALGLVTGAAGAAVLGAVSLLIWFVYLASRFSGSQQTAQRTKEQMKEEEERGIIDFSKKD